MKDGTDSEYEYSFDKNTIWHVWMAPKPDLGLLADRRQLLGTIFRFLCSTPFTDGEVVCYMLGKSMYIFVDSPTKETQHTPGGSFANVVYLWSQQG